MITKPENNLSTNCLFKCAKLFKIPNNRSYTLSQTKTRRIRRLVRAIQLEATTSKDQDKLKLKKKICVCVCVSAEASEVQTHDKKSRPSQQKICADKKIDQSI